MKSMMIKTAVLGLAAACSGVALAKSGEVSIIQCGGGEVQNVATSTRHRSAHTRRTVRCERAQRVVCST